MISAFWELSTDRQIGFSAGPIPWSSIRRWLDHYGSEYDSDETFIECIRAMDSVFIAHKTGGKTTPSSKAVPAAELPKKTRNLSVKLFDAMFAGKKPKR